MCCSQRFLWLVLLCCWSILLSTTFAQPACDTPGGGDRRVDKQRLRIVQFNAYWLFLENWSAVWQSAAEADAHASAIAAELDSLDADIVHLCEVESCATLATVRSKMRNGEQYKIFFVLGTDTATGQNVVLLSRVDPQALPQRSDERAAYPVAASKCGYVSRQSSSSGVSKHLFVDFRVANFPAFVLVGAHLIAGTNDASRCAQREAQALVLQNIVKSRQQLSRNQSIEFVILGDLNDFDDDVVDAANNRPLSQTLQLLHDSLSPELVNVAARARQSDRWTYCGGASCPRPQCSMVDHVLLSSALAALVARDEGALFGDRTQSCRGATGSDHVPVIVDLVAAGSTDAQLSLLALLVGIVVLWFVIVVLCVLRRTDAPLAGLAQRLRDEFGFLFRKENTIVVVVDSPPPVADTADAHNNDSSVALEPSPEEDRH